MIKKTSHKAFSFLLALLLAAGLAVPLVGCTEEDALDLLTAVVENLPEETEARHNLKRRQRLPRRRKQPRRNRGRRKPPPRLP